MRVKLFSMAFLGLLAIIPATGCVGVKPWERTSLGTYPMRSDRDQLNDSLAEHVYFTRESAAGGRGVGGGGCGCN
jgi:hypothetical protein